MINRIAINAAQAHSARMQQGAAKQPIDQQRTTDHPCLFSGPLGLIGKRGVRGTAGLQNISNFHFRTFVSSKQGHNR